MNVFNMLLYSVKLMKKTLPLHKTKTLSLHNEYSIILIGLNLNVRPIVEALNKLEYCVQGVEHRLLTWATQIDTQSI